MNPVFKTMAVWAVMVVAAVSVYSQDVSKEDTKNQSTQTTVVDQQTTTTPNYVFPTHKERFDRYVKSTVGPFRLAWTAASAGIAQWRDHPEEWEQGMKGYGKRYASSFGQNAIPQTVPYGFDEAFHLDTGFEKSKSEGFWPRAKDALIQQVTSRTRSGKRVVAVPRFAGIYTGAIVAREPGYPHPHS